MELKTDDVLKALVEKGKQTGSLTYDEVNLALPENADPDRLPEILELLEQHGVSLIDADEAEELEGAAGTSTTRSACTSPRWARSRC